MRYELRGSLFDDVVIKQDNQFVRSGTYTRPRYSNAMDEEIAVRIDALTIGIELPTTCKTDAMYDMYMNPAAAGVCIDGQMGGTARLGTARLGTKRLSCRAVPPSVPDLRPRHGTKPFRAVPCRPPGSCRPSAQARG